jgi:hypothetical protein
MTVLDPLGEQLICFCAIKMLTQISCRKISIQSPYLGRRVRLLSRPAKVRNGHLRALHARIWSRQDVCTSLLPTSIFAVRVSSLPMDHANHDDHRWRLHDSFHHSTGFHM